ncbi:MAG: hypothetical protein QXR84_08865 [Candidatus Bathyarchaeia archaeon]
MSGKNRIKELKKRAIKMYEINMEDIHDINPNMDLETYLFVFKGGVFILAQRLINSIDNSEQYAEVLFTKEGLNELYQVLSC